ncbi:hypothetical protein Gogos_020673 [Gossypium gossypioides]|uniref:Uncharacterized protein n=1 Tax=Gossypium gossypioides TaxID=34282 RepID=A0A7J9D1B4_GOSGO|nr:hypothetical protein [Gossypium gossypioides]
MLEDNISSFQATISSISNTLEQLLETVQRRVEMSTPVKEVKHEIQLVILPLSRERGLRCSVKPASRSTLYFRNHEAQSLHSSPLAQLSTWNGQARVKPPEIPTQQSQARVPSP